MAALEKLKNLILGEAPQPLNLRPETPTYKPLSYTEAEWNRTLAPSFSKMGEQQAISGGDFPPWLDQAAPHIIEAYRTGYAETLQKLRTLRPIQDDNNQQVWVDKDKAAKLEEEYIKAARAKMSEEEKIESVKTFAYFLADNNLPIDLETDIRRNPNFSAVEKRAFLETYATALRENEQWDGTGPSPGTARFMKG